MTLAYIFAFTAVALLIGLVLRNRWRVYLLMGISALAVFLLQPALPILLLQSLHSFPAFFQAFVTGTGRDPYYTN